MTKPATAAEVARQVADVLTTHHLPYAIGGAIALAYYAPPRATVDVNVFVPPERDLAAVLAALAEAGFAADEPEPLVARQATTEGQFRGRIAGLRVDVFVPAIDYYGELEPRCRTVTLFGRPLAVLGPEDLVALKMMFFRRKDLADVEAVMRDAGAALDRGFIRTKLSELAGADDERLRALAEIERDVDGEA